MKRFVTLAIVLGACGTTPAPTDVVAPRDTVDARVADVSPDVFDAAEPVDAGADSSPMTDIVEDVPGLDVAMLDIVEAATPADVVDVTAPDAQPDVQPDVPTDVPPTYPDLNGFYYPTIEFRSAFRLSCDPSISGCAPSDQTIVSPREMTTNTGCSFVQGHVNYYVWVCDDDHSTCVAVSGHVYETVGGGATTVEFASGTRSAETIVTTRSARYASGTGASQNFHIQFSMAATPTARGAVGIPGTTVDPALGDLWLLGCRLQ